MRDLREIRQEAHLLFRSSLGDERVTTVIQPVPHEHHRIIEGIKKHQFVIPGKDRDLIHPRKLPRFLRQTD